MKGKELPLMRITVTTEILMKLFIYQSLKKTLNNALQATIHHHWLFMLEAADVFKIDNFIGLGGKIEGKIFWWGELSLKCFIICGTRQINTQCYNANWTVHTEGNLSVERSNVLLLGHRCNEHQQVNSSSMQVSGISRSSAPHSFQKSSLKPPCKKAYSCNGLIISSCRQKICGIPPPSCPQANILKTSI